MTNKRLINLVMAGTIALTSVGTGLSMGVGATSSAATAVSIPASYGGAFNSQQLSNIAKLSNEQRVALKNNVVASTRKYLGLPYIYGGNNPRVGLDCSSLMQWGYRGAGIQLPRTAEQQRQYSRAIPSSQLQPGDFIFWSTGPGRAAYHVAMVVDSVNKIYMSEPAPGKVAHLMSYKYGFGEGYATFGSIIPRADFNAKPAPAPTTTKATPAPTKTTTKPSPTSTNSTTTAPKPTTTTPKPTSTSTSPKPSATTTKSSTTTSSTTKTSTSVTTTPPVTTPPIVNTITIKPDADTYIDSSAAKNNFGSSKTLKVTNNTKGNYDSIFMNMPVKGVSGKTLKSAKLRIYISKATSQTLRINYGNTKLAPEGWKESTLTYDNVQPGSTLGGTPNFVISPKGLKAGWNEISISNFTAFGSDGNYQFIIDSNGQSDTETAVIASREDTAHAPELVLETK